MPTSSTPSRLSRPNQLSLYSPAKLNWFLNVTGTRADGHHDLVTVLQTITSPALTDTITLILTEQNLSDADAFRFVCTHPALQLQPEANLITRAYRLYAQAYQQATGTPLTMVLPSLTVTLEKQIPLQAGLGGGSSNAATLLKGLNQLTQQVLPEAILHALASQLGADVPFFLTGGTALGTGRGDALTPLPGSPHPLPLLIVKANNLASDTAAAYRTLRAQNAYKTVDPNPLLAALAAGDLTALEAAICNDFEAALFPGEPQYQQLITGFQQLGIRRPFLCGSGAAMAGICRREISKAELQSVFPTNQFQTAEGTTASYTAR